MKYTMSVLVENHPGVLSRVSGLFSRRGFNIDSLAVGVTEDPAISRMTIVVDGDEYVVEQLDKQLNKVIPVIKVKTLKEGDYIPAPVPHQGVGGRGQRAEIMRVSELMGAKIVDATRTTMTHRVFRHRRAHRDAGNPSAPLRHQGSGAHRHHRDRERPRSHPHGQEKFLTHPGMVYDDPSGLPPYSYK